MDLSVVAERALRRSVAAALVTDRKTVEYDPYLAGREVDQVRGLATTPAGETLEWSAIVKVTTGPGIRAARRELTAYRSGLAAAHQRSALRGPDLLGWVEEPDRIELWLEQLVDEHAGVWTPERFAIAAEHIGRWDAIAKEVPAGFDSGDGWAEQHGQPHRLDEALAELDALHGKPPVPELDLLGPDWYDATRALIASTPERIARLATYPQTLMHHDLVRSNLFALSPGCTVAIDWEYVDRGPLGVDLAPLVIGSVRRGEASADDLPAIEAGVLTGYERGLATGDDIRTPYRLAVGLRWHVVLGTIRAALDPTSSGMRGSRRTEPRAEALHHLLGVSRHILTLGREN